MKIHSQYTPTEEIFHGITHGIGASLSIAGLVILVVLAAQMGDVWRIVSFSIYGGSLTILYLASTLYHSFQDERLKQFFRHFDHLSIFLLIAGTYTPVTLISLRGAWGWTLFALIWGFAVSGIVYELLFLGRYKWITMSIYLGMGWLAVVAIKPMLTMVPRGLFWWLLAGGLCYTGGVFFYARKKMRYHHVLWHLFVLFGSACHFLGFFFYLT
ncbi:MAG: hemolysin III family protein [Deltaproteobacteria bacterium]|nr:hemolysin III family protein [Deltaproteobacteria bacterium]